jgi:hypothetical protein
MAMRNGLMAVMGEALLIGGSRHGRARPGHPRSFSPF